MGLKIAAPSAKQYPPQPALLGVGMPSARPPAAASGSPAAKKKPSKPRARKSPLAVLELEDPRLALLCACTDYVDCRAAHTTVEGDALERPGTLFQLRATGRVRGFSATKRQIWHIPSEVFPHGGAISWPLLRSTRRSEVELVDAAGQVVRLSIFGNHRPWLAITEDEELLIQGEAIKRGAHIFLSCQRLAPASVLGRVWTRYVGTSQISGEKVEALVHAALADPTSARACATHIIGQTGLTEDALLEQCLPEDGEGFHSLEELVLQLHQPSTYERALLAAESARRLSALAIHAAALRYHLRPSHPQAPLAVRQEDLLPVREQLTMPLTGDQEQVAAAIVRGLSRPAPMNALLSGDVGTGKTLSFLLPAIAAHRAGARVAIVTPRMLLADQIAQEALRRFSGVLTKLERVEAGGRIHDPSSLLVGTAGLAGVARHAGYVPNLLILDEQHKFSTAEREALVGPYTHVVEVSATPVPRSLAASLYEGMEILNLRQCPVDKTIESEVLDMSRRGEVVARIREALSKGERAAVIYPQVNQAEDETEEGQAKANSVEAAFDSLSQVFPGEAVMLHGNMDEAIMRSNIAMLRSGARKLVIASTVLEIGIDIPSVSVLIVRDADRFGISQLHQLRGRLARNGGHGRFMMVVESESQTPPDALERLYAVAETTDGYELAERDLLIRGFGDVDGAAQTGASRTLFRMVKIRPGDFMRRRLRTGSAQLMAELGTADAVRTYASDRGRATAPVQGRLL